MRGESHVSGASHHSTVTSTSSCHTTITRNRLCPTSLQLTDSSHFITITLFFNLPHRPLTSLHPVLHPLRCSAHLYFHTPPVANSPPISPVSPSPSPSPPTFHPHHHPPTSALLSRGWTPCTDPLLLFFHIFLLLHLFLLSLCSPSLDVQPGKHREETSEDAA